MVSVKNYSNLSFISFLRADGNLGMYRVDPSLG